MKKVVRLVCVVLIMAMVLTATASCGKSSAGGKSAGVTNDKNELSSDGKTKLTFWCTDWGEPVVKKVREAFDTYNKQSDKIFVDLIKVPVTGNSKYSPYDEKLLPAMAGGNPPDMIMVYSIPPMVQEDMLEDITGYIENDSKFNMDIYYKPMAEAGYYKGRIYALPQIMDVGGFLMYNKTLFKKYGLDPSTPPKTIQELDKMAEKMFIPNDDGTYASMGFIPWAWLMRNFITYPFGGGWYDANGNPDPTNPRNVEALEWVAKYIKKYGYEKVNKSADINSPLSSGKVGMEYAYNGDLLAAVDTDKWSFEWDIAEFPKAHEDAEPAWLSAGWCAIPKGAKHIKESMDFLKFYCGVEGTKMAVKNGFYFMATAEGNEANLDKMHPTLQVLIKDIVPQIKTQRSSKNNIPQYDALIKNLVDRDMYKADVEFKQVLTDIDKAAKAINQSNSK